MSPDINMAGGIRHWNLTWNQLGIPDAYWYVEPVSVKNAAKSEGGQDLKAVVEGVAEMFGRNVSDRAGKFTSSDAIGHHSVKSRYPACANRPTSEFITPSSMAEKIGSLSIQLLLLRRHATCVVHGQLLRNVANSGRQFPFHTAV